jgi:hypothetical protein
MDWMPGNEVRFGVVVVVMPFAAWADIADGWCPTS